MSKNKIWLGIILSIILLVFSINGFTAYYKYTQESGDNFYVGTGDKADALEDTNEIRQIIDDLGALLVHSKRDGSYPKTGPFGGTIQIPEAGLKFGNAPENNDIAAYIAGEMTWQTKAELGLDLSLYYLKTAIDTQGEVETIWGVTLATDTELAALTYSDVGAEQADAGLTSLAGLTYVSPSFIKVTATDTYAIRTLVEVRTDLGLVIGTNIMAWDAQLDDIAALAYADGNFIVGDGSNWIAESGSTARTSLGIDLSLYYLKTEIDTLSEVETIYTKDIIDSDELAALKFTDLDDTPANYTGQAGKYVKVNAGETALEFGTPTGGAGTYLELTDTPAAYDNGKYAKSTADGVVWDDPAGTTFAGLTDTPANYTNKAGKTLKVNSTPNAVEFANDTNVTTKSGTCTLTIAEQGTIFVSASSAYTITLPTAVGNAGLTYHFIKTDANYNLITLDGNASETLNYPCDAGTPQLTYPRLNTLGAKVTIVSDNSNWIVTLEDLGQIPKCDIYQTVAQTTHNAKQCGMVFDTESYDIGNNFSIATWITGSATATTANHLIDTTTSPFTSDMLYYRVKNTTDTTYAYVVTFNSASDVTLSADIFVNGEGYEIKKSTFTAPITGTYLIRPLLTLSATNMVDQKKIVITLYKNGNNNVGSGRINTSGTEMHGTQTTQIISLTKDDSFIPCVYQNTGNSIDTYAGAGFNSMQIMLLEKE